MVADLKDSNKALEKELNDLKQIYQSERVQWQTEVAHLKNEINNLVASKKQKLAHLPSIDNDA